MACIAVVLQARVSSVCISLGNGEFRPQPIWTLSK
jgi:hypothetical protein